MSAKDPKAYQRRWREEHPNYHREWMRRRRRQGRPRVRILNVMVNWELFR
jgi:hypothetical protein